MKNLAILSLKNFKLLLFLGYILPISSLPAMGASIEWGQACKPDEEFRLTLRAMNPRPDLSQVTPEALGVTAPAILSFVDPRPSVRNFTLIGCYDAQAQQATLVQFASNIGGTGDLQRFDAKNSSITILAGLSETLFGDASKLHVEVQKNNGTQLRVRGWKSQLATFVTYDFSELGRIYFDVVVGEVTQGDAFAKPTDCRDTETGARGGFRTLEKQIGTAKIVADACVYNNGGRSLRYKFLAIEVTDTISNLLGVPAERRTVRLTDLEGLLLHRESHHNWCDNFYLKVPEFGAEYAEVLWNVPLPGYPIAPKSVGSKYAGQEWVLDAGAVTNLLCY